MTVDAPAVATLSNDNNKKGGIKTTTILAAISSALGFLVMFIKNKLADREGREEKRSRKKKSEKTGRKDGPDASDEPGVLKPRVNTGLFCCPFFGTSGLVK